MKKTLNKKKKELFKLLVQYYELKPEEKWCVGRRTSPTGDHCALGWLDEDFVSLQRDPILREYLVVGAVLELTKMPSTYYGIIEANNEHLSSYQQPTPKQRVLAYLNDEINKL